MKLSIVDHWIPLQRGHAARPGWTTVTGRRPRGVTWHWTATRDLDHCTRLLGGSAPERQGIASAHLAIGRDQTEGVHRYVALDNRSWHAGKRQTLRWDGKPFTDPRYKASRTTIGLETVNIGYARDGVEAEDDWIVADTPEGRSRRYIQPWGEEQVAMMIAVGKLVVARWPRLAPRDHHGHYDLCPGYKEDPIGFPFARVLQGIYDDSTIPDVWSSVWCAAGRQRALAAVGEDPGSIDDRWGDRSDAALRSFQRHEGMAENGMWSTFVAWRLHDRLVAQGATLEQAASD